MSGKKLGRPFQVVKNVSFHPSFKPSVNEGKVSHQLLLNGKLVTNRKFQSDGKKRSEGLGFKKLLAMEVLEASISSLKPRKAFGLDEIVIDHKSNSLNVIPVVTPGNL